MINNKPSQKEIIANLDAQLFQIDSTNIKNNSDYTFLLDQLPTGLQLNSYNGVCRFMNKYTQDYLGVSLGEISLIGEKYKQLDIFSQEEIASLLPKIKEFHHQNSTNGKLSVFQRIKPRGKKHFEWVYITSKLIDTPGESFKDRLLITCPVKEMGSYSEKIHKVLDENQYFKKHFKKFALLTLREKEIIPLIAVGFTNIEIAQKLFISKETVSQHRKNINRKLEFKTYYELIKFAETFEML